MMIQIVKNLNSYKHEALSVVKANPLRLNYPQGVVIFIEITAFIYPQKQQLSEE